MQYKWLEYTGNRVGCQYLSRGLRPQIRAPKQWAGLIPSTLDPGVNEVWTQMPFLGNVAPWNDSEPVYA